MARELFFALISDQAQAELFGHRLLDRLDGDLAGLRVDEVLQHLLRVRQRDLARRSAKSAPPAE